MKRIEELEMQTVLRQPHRRGNRSQLAESPLGRFVLAQSLPLVYFDAGETYASLKRRWQAAWGTPLPDRLGGSGHDVDLDQVNEWGETLKAWERVMLDAGGFAGRLSAMSLMMDRPSIQPKIHTIEAIKALHALAKAQGKLSKTDGRS